MMCHDSGGTYKSSASAVTTRYRCVVVKVNVFALILYIR